jgi:hypothetical protein
MGIIVELLFEMLICLIDVLISGRRRKDRSANMEKSS